MIRHLLIAAVLVTAFGCAAHQVTDRVAPRGAKNGLTRRRLATPFHLLASYRGPNPPKRWASPHVILLR